MLIVKATEDGVEFGTASGGFDYKTSFSYYTSSDLTGSETSYMSDEILVDTGLLTSISNIHL